MSNEKSKNHDALFVGFAASYDDNVHGENVPVRAVVRMDQATFERLNFYATDIKNGVVASITIPGDAANFRWLKAPQTDSEVIGVEGFFDAGVDALLSDEEFRVMDMDPDSTGDGSLLYQAHEMSGHGFNLTSEPMTGEVLLGIRGVCDGQHAFSAILQSWDTVARAAREVYAAADSQTDGKDSSSDVKVAVAGHNASGEPDIAVYSIHCTIEQRENGGHYALAKDTAEEDGFQPSLAFDENDLAWSMLNLKTQNSTDVLMDQGGLQVIERALLKATNLNINDAPITYDPKEAKAFKKGLASAYHHALEMMCITPVQVKDERWKPAPPERARGG